MAAHAGENDDCILSFSFSCQKTTCLVQNRIICAKMIYINTKIKKKNNSRPPLLNLKSLLWPQGQIIDIKCEK